MDDTGEGGPLLAAHGNHETAVAQGHKGLLDGVRQTGFPEESFQAALEGLLELRGTLPEGAQGLAGGVEDGAVPVQAAVQVGAEVGAGVDTGCQGRESGPGQARLAVQEGVGFRRGIEHPAHLKQVRAVKDSALGGNAAEGLSGVLEPQPREGGPGVEYREDIRIERRTGRWAGATGRGTDGRHRRVAAGRLRVPPDSLKEGTEFEDVERVLVHQSVARYTVSVQRR